MRPVPDALPPHLHERTQVVHEGKSDPTPAFVVYWMRNALRLEENPALDVARWLAAEHAVPLLVYHGLSEHYAFASDRHHTFILQGASDVQSQAAAAGLSYAFHLATPADRSPHLVNLANEGGCVVTESMPVDPPRRFLQRLLDRTSASVWCVDTSCIVPMQMVGQAYTRAFQFREATAEWYDARIDRDWPALDCHDRPFDTRQLPFEPIDFAQQSIPELVAACEIDHAVGPVVDTPGGTSAGWQRWSEFRDHRLSSYAKARNNALTNGVSRMSAYLHYGMVSPLRIARESSAIGNSGAGKYLDELLIWRELAYGFCFYRPDHARWQALPEWAQRTLEQHAEDSRKRIYDWETLARGETNDPLWNAAQRSLLMQGELHNNVRMTWGKAILHWTADPRKALRQIIDLNHRYALDGRDPASYGGILWCLGQFDRPFKPAQPVIGTVRARPTAQHAQRLSPQDYLARVTRPRFAPQPRVAVIGAGISGMMTARTLADHGVDVTVLEKSRGVGGRMATRRTDTAGHFDHGAQFFTVTDPRMRRYAHAWQDQGLIARWPEAPQDTGLVLLEAGQVTPWEDEKERYVACPSMNAIAKHLARTVPVRTRTQIHSIQPRDGVLELLDAEGQRHEFDQVILTVPAPQAVALLDAFPELAAAIKSVPMSPCWTTMVALERPVTARWLAARIENSWLVWAARNATKPGRDNTTENLVLQAGPEWSSQQLEQTEESIAQQMLDEFWRVSGEPPQTPRLLQAHRWRYALAERNDSPGVIYDSRSGIGICGDWTLGGRVQGAFLSGMAVAGRILGTLQPQKTVYEKPRQTRLF